MKKSIWILLGLFIIFMLINANTSKGSLEIKGKPAINLQKILVVYLMVWSNI